MDAKAIDLNALVERVAAGKSTAQDADLLKDLFALKAQMHVCAEALTVILTHGPFIRKHFAVGLRAEAVEALLEDVIQDEIDEKAAAILDQLDHTPDEGGGGRAVWVISAGGGAVINTDQMAFAESERQGATHCVVAQMAHKRVVLLTTADASAAGRALSAIFAGIAAKRRVLDLRKLAQAEGMEQQDEEASDVDHD